MFQYEKNDLGYVLMDDGEVLAGPMKEVAICFSYDLDMNTMLKHGAPDLVESWCEDAQQKYRLACFFDMAEELTVIKGEFDVEQLNRLIDTTGYMARFLEHHEIDLSPTGVQLNG